jgi:hypothetical protein
LSWTRQNEEQLLLLAKALRHTPPQHPNDTTGISSACYRLVQANSSSEFDIREKMDIFRSLQFRSKMRKRAIIIATILNGCRLTARSGMSL